MPPKLIELKEVGPAPLGYTLSAAESVDPQVITATFDGTAAAAGFLACCSVFAQDGRLIARCPTQTTITAGDTAEVTFGPFLRSAAAATGSGIQYGVRPQPGTFLQITTTDAGADSLDIASGGQLDMRAAETLTVLSHADLEVSSAGPMTIDSQDGITITNTAAGVLLIESSPDGGIDIRDQGGAASAGVIVESAASGVSLSGEYVTITTRSDSVYITLGAAQQVQVLNHLSAPIFEVKESGDLHGLTGKALVFDL